MKQKYKIGERCLFIAEYEIYIGTCAAAYLLDDVIVYGFNVYDNDSDYPNYIKDIPEGNISKSVKKLEKKLKKYNNERTENSRA